MFTLKEVLEWDGISVIDSLIHTGLCKTKSEARRMIEQGAIKVDDIKVESHTALIMVNPVTKHHCLLQNYNLDWSRSSTE